MKKNLIIAIAMTGLLASCGGPKAEDFTKAANKVCDCMSEKAPAREGKSADAMQLSVAADYAMCTLGTLSFSVDPTSDEFTKAIDANCPTLSAAQADYAKK